MAANNPIRPDTPDEEIWKRGWQLANNLGLPVAVAQHILLLERRIAVLEQGGTPVHLRDVEKR